VSAVRAAQTTDPDDARRAAEDILADRRFRSDPAPRPLRGPLEWLGDRLETVFDWIGSVLELIPGIGWIALALAAVGALVAWIVRRARRRVSEGDTGARATPFEAARPERAADLERAADEAERAGDLERALRLRFRAGLLRLGERGAIDYRPSVTTGEVRRVLHSDRFDELAGTFEEVAYGGRTAERPDVDAARREWPRVLEGAQGR
jgi:hypothetical protein